MRKKERGEEPQLLTTKRCAIKRGPEWVAHFIHGFSWICNEWVFGLVRLADIQTFRHSDIQTFRQPWKRANDDIEYTAAAAVETTTTTTETAALAFQFKCSSATTNANKWQPNCGKQVKEGKHSLKWSLGENRVEMNTSSLKICIYLLRKNKINRKAMSNFKCKSIIYK